MSKVRILTPAFEADDQELLASFQGFDGSRLKEKIRLGLFDNTKPNAGLFLEKIGKELSKTGIVKNIVNVAKSNPKVPNPAASEASPELLGQLAEETDFVIVGLGN